MANLRDIRRRIKSVKNTAQITKAMQLVAASKMKKAQDQAMSGRPYADLPDLGPLPPVDLAHHRPPMGESFADLAARVWPALNVIADGGNATIVAHAGTIRAALSLALDSLVSGLAFEIAPLSVTRIARLTDGAGWVVRGVNGQP